MRAIQFSELGGPEVLRYVELPDPQPGPGQVLVRVESAAVNFSDIIRRKGDPYPDPTPLPFVPGSEIAGTVVAVGEGVDDVAVGAAVFGVAGTTEGGYAEMALMGAHNAIPRPEALSVDAAAGLIVTGLSAAVLLTEAGHLAEGRTVFVPAAAGGLGAYAVQIAKLLGATVIAGAGTEAKRSRALEYGADHAIDYTSPGWAEQLRDLTGGRGVDLALEMTSPQHVVETAEALAPFGRLIAYGYVAGRDAAMDPRRMEALLFDPGDGQMISGFNLGKWFEHRLPETMNALQRLIHWAAAGQLSGPAITTLPLARAAEGQTLLETGVNEGKVILKP